MTNLGFKLAMEREGIRVATTAVGDRYVIAEMLKGDHVLGGEQSGHIINRNVSTTGDGLATSLLLLQALREMEVPLHEAAKVMSRLPQRLVNVPVRDRKVLAGATAVWEAVAAEEQRLGADGRVLVRPSGTEPLVRVMVEAPTLAECDAVCRRLADVVAAHLG
jgi:phosphoglucosamine mutase